MVKTVEENIAFHNYRRSKEAERKAKASRIVDLVGLTGREKSYPSQLSGDKSKGGIARALLTDRSPFM